jgi:hypothetical protein
MADQSRIEQAAASARNPARGTRRRRRVAAAWAAPIPATVQSARAYVRRSRCCIRSAWRRPACASQRVATATIGCGMPQAPPRRPRPCDETPRRDGRSPRSRGAARPSGEFVTRAASPPCRCRAAARTDSTARARAPSICAKLARPQGARERVPPQAAGLALMSLDVEHLRLQRESEGHVRHLVESQPRDRMRERDDRRSPAGSAAEAAMRSTYMVSARSALMTSASCCALASSRSSTMRTAASGSFGTAKVPCSRLCARSERTSPQRSSSFAG